MACGGGERSCRGRGGVSRGAGESEEIGFEEGCCSHAPAACAAARGGGRCCGDGLTMASNAVHVRDDMSTSSTRGEPAWAPRPLCEDGLRRRSACGHPMPEPWSCGGAPKMARKASPLRRPRWVLQEGAAPAARSASQALQTEVGKSVKLLKSFTASICAVRSVLVVAPRSEQSFQSSYGSCWSSSTGDLYTLLLPLLLIQIDLGGVALAGRYARGRASGRRGGDGETSHTESRHEPPRLSAVWSKPLGESGDPGGSSVGDSW